MSLFKAKHSQKFLSVNTSALKLRTNTHFCAAGAAILLITVQNSAAANSQGEYPGTGDYSAWQQAANSDEDGIDYAKKGNYTMALQCYEEAIQLYPYDALFYYNKGVALSKIEKANAALAEFQKAIKLEPNFASAWYDLGNAQQHNHDLVAAESSFRQAIKLDPKHKKAYFNLAQNLFFQKKLQDAKVAFTQAQEFATTEQDKKEVHENLFEIERLLKK